MKLLRKISPYTRPRSFSASAAALYLDRSAPPKTRAVAGCCMFEWDATAPGTDFWHNAYLRMIDGQHVGEAEAYVKHYAQVEALRTDPSRLDMARRGAAHAHENITTVGENTLADAQAFVARLPGNMPGFLADICVDLDLSPRENRGWDHAGFGHAELLYVLGYAQACVAHAQKLLGLDETSQQVQILHRALDQLRRAEVLTRELRLFARLPLFVDKIDA